MQKKYIYIGLTCECKRGNSHTNSHLGQWIAKKTGGSGERSARFISILKTFRIFYIHENQVVRTNSGTFSHPLKNYGNIEVSCLFVYRLENYLVWLWVYRRQLRVYRLNESDGGGWGVWRWHYGSGFNGMRFMGNNMISLFLK